MKKLALVALIPGSAMAHPGHIEAAANAHWVTQWDHLAVVGLAVAFIALTGVLARGLARRRVRE
ncbi:MAG: hypothetical protein KDK26_17045 [Roseivivax sp.]|nr:hypothetical protein [Roseivivax sp.]